MNKIKLSFDNQKFQSKPSIDEVRYINSRIAKSVKEVEQGKMKELAYSIGQDGCTFCPATFKNGKRNKDNFEQQQLIALDFDNKDPDNKISFEEIKARADYYELPIFFAYDTLSSSNHDKFRVVFLNDVLITQRKIVEAVQMALGEIFPEADPSCYKDASKLYFGGKEVIYYDEKISKINIESVFRNFTCCMKEKYKPNHYKDHIARFAKATGIALNAKGLLDVKISDYLPETDNPTEESGAKDYYKNGKNSPSTIICSNKKEMAKFSRINIILLILIAALKNLLSKLWTKKIKLKTINYIGPQFCGIYVRNVNYLMTLKMVIENYPMMNCSVLLLT